MAEIILVPLEAFLWPLTAPFKPVHMTTAFLPR
jgi:hypothetical protein